MTARHEQGLNELGYREDDMSKITGDQKIEKIKASVSALMILIIACFFMGCAIPGNRSEGADNILVESPSISDAEERSLQPGLSVYYVHGFWRHIDQMPGEKKAKRTRMKGTPIAYLNHRFGEGMVFKSGRAKGVGMYMNGYIHFDKPGVYVFQARTNDGFRLSIHGMQILQDPNVHSDRLSKAEKVEIRKPGWHPIKMQYFQRKGTSTLELYWTEPGDKEKSIIPKEAFAHIPN
jgi:hypothetical protein